MAKKADLLKKAEEQNLPVSEKSTVKQIKEALEGVDKPQLISEAAQYGIVVPPDSSNRSIKRAIKDAKKGTGLSHGPVEAPAPGGAVPTPAEINSWNDDGGVNAN